MKNFNFNFKSIVRSKARWLLTLFAILTLGVGQMWADGGIGYKGVKFSKNGSTTGWYNIHHVANWDYTYGPKSGETGVTAFNNADLGTVTTLKLEAFVVIGWTDNSDYVAGQLKHRLYLQSASAGSYNTYDVGNYSNPSWGATDVVASSGNNRVVGKSSSMNVDIVTSSTPAGNYYLELQGLGRMQYTGGGGGSFKDNNGSEVKATLLVPGFSTTSTSHDFGSVTVDNSSSTTISFTQHYGTTLTTSNCAITGTNASDFSVTSISETGVTVSFTPAASGSRSATLTITDANSKTCTISLSGTGTVETTHSVAVTYKCTQTNANVKSAENPYIGEVTTQTFTAGTPKGYNFTSWSIGDGLTVTSGSSSTNSITVKTKSSGTYTLQANYDEVLTSTYYLVGNNLDIFPGDETTWKAETNNMLRKASGSSTGDVGSITIEVKSIPANNSDYQFKIHESSANKWWGWSNDNYYWMDDTKTTSLYDNQHNLYFIPNALGDYTFSTDWSDADEPSLTVTFPATTYTVNFGQGSGTAGSASATYSSTSFTSGTKVQNGKSITLTAPAASTGYTWDGWYNASSGGTRVSTSNPLTTTISSTNHDFYARYTETTYTVTFNDGDHGTVSPSGDQQVGVSGKSITATPAGGYKFDHWSKTGDGVTLSSTTDNPTTVTAAGTGSVTANYAERYILRGSLKADKDPLGGMAGWSATSNATYTGWTIAGQVLTIPATLIADTTYKFRVVDMQTGTAHGQTGTSTITASSKWTLNGSNDVYLKTTEEGEYLFVIDFSGSNPQVSVAYPGQYLSGDFTDWGQTEDNIRFDANGEASVELEEGNHVFKIIYGGGWYGKNDFTVTTTVLDQTLSTSGANCNITVPAGGGTYLFTWDALNTKLSVFTSADAAKAKLTKNTYIYCDARGNGNWKSADFDARFWFKNYGSGTDIVPAVTCNKTNALQDWVFYAQVPNSDLVGRVQMNRLKPEDHSVIWTTSSVIQAYTRSNANQNCMVVDASENTLTWGTYCPPMKTVTLSDNSTVTYGGNGSKATPYLVEKGGTIRLQAHTTKYFKDDNMTQKFLFFDAATKKVDQTDSAYNYTANASADVVHKMVVKTYNTFNSVNGDTIEIANTDTLFYQTVTCYNVTYSAPTNGDYTISVAGGSASSETKKAIAGQTITLSATPVNQAYTFKAWTVTNTSTSADVTATLLPSSSTTASTSFTMPSVAVTVTAVFEPRFALMGSRNTVGGEEEGMPGWTPKNILPDFTVNSVGTPDGSGNVTTNLTCVRTLLPNRSYKFEVYDRKDKVLRSTSALEDQVTLAANASLQLTSTWDEVGENTNHDVLIYTVGYGTYTFKITAISADGYPTITVERQASYLLNMGCTDNGSVSAETTEGGQHFAITNGQYVASGGTITFTASPNVGYALDGWYHESTYENRWATENPKDLNSISAEVFAYAKFVPATLTFVGGHDGGEWNSVDNWDPACIPTIDHDVVLEANAVLYGYFGGESGHGRAKSIKIDKSVEGRKNIRLSIWTCSSLIVAEDITAKHVGDDDFGAVNAEDLYIETTVLGNGVLICGSANANTAATYDFHSKAYKADSKWYINQYVGIPFAELDADKMRGFNIFVYDDAEDDWRTPGSKTMNPWTAYDLLCIYPGGVGNQELKGTLLFPGTGAGKTKTLSPTRRDPKDGKWTVSHPFPTSIDGTAGHQDHMFANSWTAPIDIAEMEESDFTHLVHTIYIFNAGYEGEGVRKLGDDAGQWSSFPLAAVQAGEIENAVIPATQAFLVTDTASGSSITLNYKKHVYDPAKASSDANDTINNFPTRAPRRVKKSSSLNSLTMFVRSEEDVIADRLYIIEGNNLRTDTFDNGWDGNKIMGESFAPQLYSMSGTSKMYVNAVKDMEGMKIGFKAGTSAQDYTLSFDYEEQAEPLYLYDKETNAYIEITNEATYEFTTTDRKAHERFLLTRSNSPQIATGVEEIDTENVQRAQKFMQDQQIFIRRGDKIYSVDGALVK